MGKKKNFQKVINKAVEITLIKKILHSLEPKEMLTGYNNEKPVFIIGPPRSGTTLIYQLILGKFSFSYINRLMNLFYYAPFNTAKLSRYISKFFSSDLNAQNNYGTLPGVFSPDEGGKIWLNLIPGRDNTGYIPPMYCSENQINELRKLIIETQEIFERPFINKRPSNSLRVAALQEAFPNALFIIVVRDQLYNAQSLYLARQNRTVDKNGWWGSKPKEYPVISTYDSVRQSVNQVYCILKQIDTDIQYFNNRYLLLKYEDICENPNIALDSITSFFLKHRLNVIDHENFHIPVLTNGNTIKIDIDVFEKLEKEVIEVFKQSDLEMMRGVARQ